MRLKPKLILTNLSLALMLVISPIAQSQLLPQPATNASQLAANRYDSSNAIFHPVYGKNGMVASEQGLATQVGLDILKQGGNAIDAAVAVGFALAVVLPNAGNIGGGGFMVLHDDKTGKDVAIDFREIAPAKASRDMYLDNQGNVIDGKSLFTHDASGVPGTVAGMEYALKNGVQCHYLKCLSLQLSLQTKGLLSVMYWHRR